MIRREARRYSERSDTARTSGAGCVPADSPPEAGVCIAGEGREGLEALHEVVEVRPARRHLGRVALPQNLPPGQKAARGVRPKALAWIRDSQSPAVCLHHIPTPPATGTPPSYGGCCGAAPFPCAANSQCSAPEAAHAVAHTSSRSWSGTAHSHCCDSTPLAAGNQLEVMEDRGVGVRMGEGGGRAWLRRK